MWDNIDQELLRDLSALMESSRGNGNVNVEQIAMKMTMVRVMTDKILNRTAELEREKQRYVDRKNEEIESFVENSIYSSLSNAMESYSGDIKGKACRLNNSYDAQIKNVEEQMVYYRDILSKLMKNV